MPCLEGLEPRGRRSRLSLAGYRLAVWARRRGRGRGRTRIKQPRSTECDLSEQDLEIDRRSNGNWNGPRTISWRRGPRLHKWGLSARPPGIAECAFVSSTTIRAHHARLRPVDVAREPNPMCDFTSDFGSAHLQLLIPRCFPTRSRCVCPKNARSLIWNAQS